MEQFIFVNTIAGGMASGGGLKILLALEEVDRSISEFFISASNRYLKIINKNIICVLPALHLMPAGLLC